MSEVYIGIKPCGCPVVVVVNEPAYPKDVAKSVSAMIRSGYAVEGVSREEAVNRLVDCKCVEKRKEANV